MDHGDENVKDSAVEDDCENSSIGTADFETSTCKSNSIQNGQSESGTVALKTSLSEKDIQIETESVYDTEACVHDTNRREISMDEQDVLQVSTTVLPDESVALPALNNINNKIKVPNNNFTSVATLDSCMMEIEPDKDVNDSVNESTRNANKKDNKIDNIKENKMNESTSNEAETILNLNGETTISISSQKSELCQNNLLKDKEIETIEKMNNNKQFPNANKNFEKLQNANSADIESDKRTSNQDSKTNNVITNITTKKELLINEVEETEIAINDQPHSGEKEIELCEDVYNKNVESSKELDKETQNTKQEPSNNEDAKLGIDDKQSPELVVDDRQSSELIVDKQSSNLVVDDKQSPELIVEDRQSPELIVIDRQSPELVIDNIQSLDTKENTNVKNAESNGIPKDESNDIIIINEIRKEELSSNKVESAEKINTKSQEVNIPCQNDNEKMNKITLEALPIEHKGRRSSKTSPKCISSSCSTPSPVTPRGGRGRGRDRGSFEVTEKLLVPFKLGWLREVVERATCASPKRMWDVYYRSPDGTKKMRSMPDVINYLKLHPECDLTHENFTFFKTHIYREPFELTRKAKMRPSSQIKSPKTLNQENKSKPVPSSVFNEQVKPEIVCKEEQSKKKAKPEIIECEEEPPKKRVKSNSCKDQSITKEKSVVQVQESKKETPKKHNEPLILRRRSSRSHKQIHVDVTVVPNKAPNIYEKVYTKLTKPRNDYSRPLRKQINVTAQDDDDNVTKGKDISKNQTAVSKSATAFTSELNEKIKKITIKLPVEPTNMNKKINKSPNEEMPGIDVNLCSNRCPGCIGEIPSLQCIVCLCLFHPRCMGLNKASTNFICKRCNTIKTKRTQDKHHKIKDGKTETPSQFANALEQNDSDSTDEDNTTNVSVLAPEVVIQHEGSDQEEIIVPTSMPYNLPHTAAGPINTVAASGQYQEVILNSKTNFIRPVPPLTPFPPLTPAPQISQQLLSSKRVIASSTYFPPPVSESPVIRVVSSDKYNTYPSVCYAACPRVASTNTYSPLIGNPPVCSSVRLISPQQLMNTPQPPPLGIPRPTLMQNSVNTRPPPLRLVTPTSISPNVGNCSRIVLPNNAGSCLVFTPPTGVIGPGTTTRLIGPFPSSSLPQIMVVNNKVICVNPVGNPQLVEQRNPSLLTNITSIAPSFNACSSKDSVLESKTACLKVQQNNPCLAALLNKTECNTTVKNTDFRPTNVPSSTSSVPLPTVTVIDSKVSSTVTPKLTAVIPPSFPVSKNSILQSNIQSTTAASCLLPAVSFSEDCASLESPYSNMSSYTQSSNLAKHIEERFKLCISASRTVVLADTSSSGMLNPNINKRMETSTTPAIKSPMTTARLLKGTESSLSFPEAKTSPSDKHPNSNSELNEKKRKLFVPLSSSSLNIENQHTSEPLDSCSSIGAEQNNLLGEHAYSSITFDSIRDQPFRTTAFTPSFTTMMNTMTTCYSCLNNIFQYLTTTDLLRVKLVCKSWYRLASQQFLWRKVSLRNLTIVDWRKFATALELHGTTYLDLRGHVLFHDTWQNFVSVLSRLDKLRHVECGLIPAFVLYAMASKLVNLRSLTGECAMFSHWTTGRVGPCVINFNLLENFREMEKFQLRCKEGLMATVMGGLSPISHLSKLRHLSLTTLESVDSEQFKFLNKLSNLEVLEIGDCNSWTQRNYASIGKMTNLHTLRLEKGGETEGMVDALSNLTRLKELHLVVYKVPPSLGTALQKLEKLRLLSLWPDTSSNGPFQNYKAVHAVSSLTHLRELRWIILSNSCDIPDKASMDEGNCWREWLEEFEECHINFSDPNSDIPLVPIAEFDKIAKSRSLKNAPRCITVNGLRESLQEALPATEIKMFQIPVKQLRRYSAFR